MSATGSEIDLIFDDLPLINDRRGKGFLIGNIRANIEYYSRSEWNVASIVADGVALDKDDDRALWRMIENAINETQVAYIEREIGEAIAGDRWNYIEDSRDDVALQRD